jgi:hypothetical protein
MATVQQTVLVSNRVEMILADKPERKDAKEWVEFSMEVETTDGRPLGVGRLKALLAAQTIIASEIRAVAQALHRYSASLERDELDLLAKCLPSQYP